MSASPRKVEGDRGALPGAAGWEGILTPGHSPGHLCLHEPDHELFSTFYDIEEIKQVPNIRKMILLRSGAEGVQTSEVEQRARTAAMVGAILNLLWVAVLFLMVFKPGT